jgi:hypothetical protein
MEHPHGIVCLWLWANPSRNGQEKAWKLDSFYFMNSDGRMMGKDTKDKEDADDFLYYKDEDGYATDNRVGRAVTMWSAYGGVSLYALNPPDGDSGRWFDLGVVEEIKKLKDWSRFIRDGHILNLGTCKLAEKHFTCSIS